MDGYQNFETIRAARDVKITLNSLFKIIRFKYIDLIADQI